jgi:hypothetical protein
MKNKLVGSTHLLLQVKATGRIWRWRVVMFIPGLLVVKAALKTKGWLLSIGYVSCCWNDVISGVVLLLLLKFCVAISDEEK